MEKPRGTPPRRIRAVSVPCIPHDARHPQEILRVRCAAAARVHLEIKENPIPLVVLLKMRIRDGHTAAREIAQLEIVRRHNRNRVRQRQPPNCLARTDDAVGGIRPAKDLINQIDV